MPTAWVNTQDTVRVPDAPPPRALFPVTNHSLPPRWSVGYLLPFPFISVLPSKLYPKPRRLVWLFLNSTQTWSFGTPSAASGCPRSTRCWGSSTLPALWWSSHCCCSVGVSAWVCAGAHPSLLPLVDLWADPGRGTRNRGCYQLPCVLLAHSAQRADILAPVSWPDFVLMRFLLTHDRKRENW